MACRARGRGGPDTVSAPELLLIHAPILLFAFPIPCFLVLSAGATGWLKILLLVGAWWCTSGAVMMAVESASRRHRYTRVLAAALRRGAGGDLSTGLRQTVCGLFLLRALRYRFGTAETKRPEGVDA